LTKANRKMEKKIKKFDDMKAHFEQEKEKVIQDAENVMDQFIDA
jgi:hypothetical protein